MLRIGQEVFSSGGETRIGAVLAAGVRVVGGGKTRFRSVSLAAVLSFQPRAPCPDKPKPAARV